MCSLFLSLRSHRVAPHFAIVRNVINHKRHLKHVLPSLENKYFLFRNSSKHSSYKIHRSPPSFCAKRDGLWVVFHAHVPFCPVGKARHFGCLPFTGANRLIYGLCKWQGTPVRDKHVPFVRLALIYIESGTSLTIGVGLGTGRKK